MLAQEPYYVGCVWLPDPCKSLQTRIWQMHAQDRSSTTAAVISDAWETH